MNDGHSKHQSAQSPYGDSNQIASTGENRHVPGTDTTSYPEKPGGGTKPPNSRSINLANSIVVRSSSCGPTICTPMGNPVSESPIGAAVAGRPGTVATLPQPRNVSIHGRFSPSISMTRASRCV